MVDEAATALEALTPAEVNGWAGKALDIALHRPLDEDDRSSAWAPRQLTFTSETFLLFFRCPTSISTPSPPMTSRVRGVCRLASATTREGCALGRPRPNRTLRQTAKIDIDGREARSCLRGRRVAASGWWFDNRGLLSTTACLSTKVTAQSPRPRPRGHRSAV
jgi:hypothetical protein